MSATDATYQGHDRAVPQATYEQDDSLGVYAHVVRRITDQIMRVWPDYNDDPDALYRKIHRTTDRGFHLHFTVDTVVDQRQIERALDDTPYSIQDWIFYSFGALKVRIGRDD